jgi:hypothetical protein
LSPYCRIRTRSHGFVMCCASRLWLMCEVFDGKIGGVADGVVTEEVVFDDSTSAVNDFRTGEMTKSDSTDSVYCVHLLLRRSLTRCSYRAVMIARPVWTNVLPQTPFKFQSSYSVRITRVRFFGRRLHHEKLAVKKSHQHKGRTIAQCSPSPLNTPLT